MSPKCTADNDPKLHVWERTLTSEHATLPDLRQLAKAGYEQLILDRKLKRAPELTAFLDACPTLRLLSLHNAKLLDPPPRKSALRRLEITGGTTTNLEFLSGFPKLQSLELAFRGSRKLTDLSGLRHVPKLRSLHANQHAASSLAPLAQLRQLREYSANSAKALKSLEGLQGCPKLLHVDANLTPIADLVPLSGAKKLMALKIRKARVESLAPLYGAKQLQTLFAEQTRLRSLDGIAAGLPALRLLWIHSTRVKDITPLGGLTSLLELDLSGLKIDDFSTLAELMSLEHLDLYETSFGDLDLLEALPNLVSARVEKTKIRKNDPRVKKLSAALREKHGEGAGLYFSNRAGLPKLRPGQAAFAGVDSESLENARTLVGAS
jgi:Leucine-rich repeat (LRR) protein